MEGIQPRYHIERYTRYHIERYKWYHIDRYERYHLSAILNKALFDEKLISEEEYSKYYYQYVDKLNELKSTKENRLATWQADLTSLRNQLSETKSNIQTGKIDKHMYVLRAPVSGTLESFSGIYSGMPVQAGSQLAVISPHSSLYAETYV